MLLLLKRYYRHRLIQCNPEQATWLLTKYALLIAKYDRYTCIVKKATYLPHFQTRK